MSLDTLILTLLRQFFGHVSVSGGIAYIRDDFGNLQGSVFITYQPPFLDNISGDFPTMEKLETIKKTIEFTRTKEYVDYLLYTTINHYNKGK